MKKINYLNNKDLLTEIHKSKNSYCYYISDEYKNYDIIVQNIKEINKKLLKKCKQEKFDLIKKNQLNNEIDNISDIKDEDIVIRCMTYEHIPIDIERSKKLNNDEERYMKLIFLPFKHYIVEDWKELIENNNKTKKYVPVLKEVGRSHWQGGLGNGWFSQDHGQITAKLGNMFKVLTEKYSQKGNWRGYTYLEEMIGSAILHLVTIGLKFDESRSQNPFAYYTAAITNNFTKVLNTEKKNQNIRDDLLIGMGAVPSYSKQVDNEISQKDEFDINI